MGFLVRLGAAFVLLALTYNPTEYNYLRWVMSVWPENMPLIVLLGLLLLAGFVVFLTAVLRGMGAFGVALTLGLCAALVWVLVDFGVLDLSNPSALVWVALVVLSVVMAAGMYWGIVWRRLSGQLEVDDEGQG